MHITHPEADDTDTYGERIKCATEITKKIARHYNLGSFDTPVGPRTADYVLSKYDVEKMSFKLRNISDFVQAIGTDGKNTYNANSAYFNAVNYFIK